ncbi:MAG: hypothetical protein PVG79_12850 [Gemmatimonadales bacterium]|jgi:hypothetical protein
MSICSRGRGGRLDRGGFSVVELLVYLVVAVIVVAAVYQLLIGQNRLFVKQRELQDVRTSLRSAANLLAFELRQTSPASGDIYAIGTSTVTLRSLLGGGIVCGIHGTEPRYGLYAVGGDFSATSNDSLLIFSANSDGPDDDSWVTTGVVTVYSSGPAGGVPDCGWTGTTADPEIVVEVDTTGVTLTGIQLGAPVREFRRTQYGLYQETDGRYWLGRRIGAASGWEQLTGPLESPTDSGLVFAYYDQAGNVTADPTQVRMVDIIIRGESYGQAPRRRELGPAAVEDTLTVRVSVRG